MAMKNKLLLLGIPCLIYVAYTISWNMAQTPVEVAVTPQVQAAVAPAPPKAPDVHELYTLSNDERIKAGLPALVLDPKLMASASDKCDDMVERDYWSHDTPDGTEPWSFIQHYTNDFYAAGENLAYGFSNAKVVTQGWMNSPGHRENILRSDYTNVGYAVCSSSNYQNQGQNFVVVQHFTHEL